MKHFFDVLLYLTFFVTIFLFIKELLYFPVWVAKIDITKNRKNKPLERYLEDEYLLLEGRIVLTVMLCATVCIVSLFLGSFPKEIENPHFLLFIPLAIWFIGTGVGGICLGQYFLNIAKRSEVYQRKSSYSTIFVRNRFHYGMGIIISFYLGCVVAFILMHLFFLLNLI